jgi:hypothetical protein
MMELACGRLHFQLFVTHTPQKIPSNGGVADFSPQGWVPLREGFPELNPPLPLKRIPLKA